MARRNLARTAPGIAIADEPGLGPPARWGTGEEEERRAGREGASGRSDEALPPAPLLAAFHDIVGNQGVQTGLSGFGTGPELLVQGALALELSGVAAPADEVLSNSAVAGWVAPAGDAGAEVAARDEAPGRPRERFPERAGRSLAAARARGGRPLPADLRADLERAFGGVDLSAVRLHADGAADRAARDLHARAFTVGTDIYFARGELRLDSPEGRRLVAHEVAHAVQHLEGRLRPERGAGDVDGTRVSAPTDASEREAEARADEVVRELDRAERAAAPEPAADPARSDTATDTTTGAPRLGAPEVGQLDSAAPVGAIEAVGLLAGEAPPAAVAGRIAATLAPSADAPVVAREKKMSSEEGEDRRTGTLTYHGQKLSELSRGELKKIRFNDKGELRYVTIDGELVPHDPGDVSPEVFLAASDLFAGRKKMYLTGSGRNKWDLKKWDLHEPSKKVEKGGKWTTGPEAGGRTVRLLQDKEIQFKTARNGRRYAVYPGVDGKNAVTWLRKGESEDDARERIRKAVNGPRDILVKPVEGDESKLRKWVHENVLAKGTMLDKRTRLAHAAYYEDEFYGQEGFLGSKAKGKTELGVAEAYGEGQLTIGAQGLQGRAAVSAKAALVNFNRTWEWETPEFDIAGETLSGRFYLFVRGMVGAEAAAAIEANVKMARGGRVVDPEQILANTGLEVDENTGVAKPPAGAANAAEGSSVNVGLKGSAHAFAGAKVTLGAGLAARWHRKDASEYGAQIRGAAQLLFDPLYAANPGLGWLLEEAGGVDLVEKVIRKFFEWNGGARKVNLMGIEALVEGSAGIGGKIEAAVGFEHGRFTFTVAANATVGVGLGSTVRINLDLAEGAKFALVVMGVFEPAARRWVEEKVDELAGEVGELIDGIIDWFSADDKAREAVAHRAHEAVGPAERARMIQAMLSGWTGDDDEQAILTILEFSKKKGDLAQVLQHVSVDDILSDLDGEEDDRAREILGVD